MVAVKNKIGGWKDLFSLTGWAEIVRMVFSLSFTYGLDWSYLCLVSMNEGMEYLI